MSLLCLIYILVQFGGFHSLSSGYIAQGVVLMKPAGVYMKAHQ